MVTESIRWFSTDERLSEERLRTERHCCRFSGSILHQSSSVKYTMTIDSSHYSQQKESHLERYTTKLQSHITTTCLDWRLEINCVGNCRWTSFMTSVTHYTLPKSIFWTCLIPFFNRSLSTRALFFREENLTRSLVCTWNTNTRRSRSLTSFEFIPRPSITVNPLLIESSCHRNE